MEEVDVELEEDFNGLHEVDDSSDDDQGQEAGGGLVSKRRKLDAGAAFAIDNPEEAEASLLDMEVNELLAEAAVDQHAEAAVHELAKRITNLLQSLPTVEVAKTTAKGFLKELGFSVTKPFIFRPPTSIQSVGSFALGAATRPCPSLDLAVELPAECFASKDQLNHRYHAKRALYLAHAAAALKGQPGINHISLGTLCNDPRKPVLLVHPPTGASPTGLTVRIIPTLPPSTFLLPRLAPHRNNLRSATAEGAAPTPAAAKPEAANAGPCHQGMASGQTCGEAEAGVPTPHYNTSVLQDMLLTSQHADCQAVASRCPNFAAAAVLLRVWARSQALDAGADGFGSFLLSMLLTDVVQKGVANPGMSAMNLFRSVLVALSNPKTFSTGRFMQRLQPSTSTNGSPPDSKAWRRHFPVVFVDRSGWLNLAAHVSRAALLQAQHCAKASLALLNAATPEAFEAVFLARRSLPSLCDYWYHISAAGEQHQKDTMSQDQPSWRSVESLIESVVSQALGTRAKWVRVFRREAAALGSLKAGAPQPQRGDVLVGVLVDPTAALRAVDIGPPAEQADAARTFREFWGDRSELRRFQDGAICEAVVWECGPSDRHLIPDRIVSYAVQRHLPSGSTVVGFAGALDSVLVRSKHISPDFDIQSARLCEAATERLGKQLRGLTGIALRVVSTQPLSSVSRHTAVFPPMPHLLAGAPHSALPLPTSSRTPTLPRCLEPVEIICQLEGSGKWPENVAAFLKTKASLGVQLAQGLQASFGLEAQASTGSYVDVLSEGFAFRLVLATERDAAMQQKALAVTEEIRMHPSLDLPLRAWHQGAISEVAGANPVFEPTARLALRWVAAHLLSPHLCQEAVELLVAHCFASGVSGPGSSAPGSRTLGLLRFLQLLCDHPWRITPLIVDPNAEMSTQQRETVVRQHSVRRAAGTAPAMYISTPKDPASMGWTYDRPSAPMLHRIAVLAKRSADTLEHLLGGNQDAGQQAQPSPAATRLKAKTKGASKGGEGALGVEAAVSQLFARDEVEYDMLIRLRAEALPNGRRGSVRFGQAASKKAAAAEAGEGQGVVPLKVEHAAVNKHSRSILSGIPQSIVQVRGQAAVRHELLVGFDPLPLLVEQLEQRYGFLAVFCADYVGGDVVGVKWRASAFVPGPLLPEHAYALRPLSAATGDAQAEQAASKSKEKSAAHPAIVGDTVPDVSAIMADISLMGAGLVERIEVLRGPAA